MSFINSNAKLLESLSQKDYENRRTLALTFKGDDKEKRFIEKVVIPASLEEGLEYDPMAREENRYPFKTQKGSSQVILGQAERTISLLTARLRYAQNIFLLGFGDNMGSSYYDGENFHIYGAFTEMAGAKYLNVFPDLAFENNFSIRGADKGDCHYKNYNIDWKSASNDVLKINVNKKDNNIHWYGAIKKIGGSYKDLSRTMKFECLGFIEHERAFQIGERQDRNIIIKKKDLKPLKKVV